MVKSADIFARAIELPVERRDAYVASCTAQDPTLRDEVLSLLASHEQLGDFLDGDDYEEPQPTAEPQVHDVAGHELVRKLGEGGFGTVHLARELGTLRRDVAIKFLKRDLVSPKALERFDSERQILANLQHDGIARIFTAGTAKAGCPYYTMEWVDGPPIDEHCDHQRLEIVQRVEIMLSVCRAVAHAHQRGVIHGDLKPRNVLVCRHSEEPSPKVIDFGVARSLGDPMPTAGSTAGTPRYMSPEQRAGVQPDARCDVYALGVMLHDLLVGRHAGQRPDGDEENTSTQRTLRALQEQASEEIAANRSVSARRLRRLLGGDLDRIVRTATRTDADHRYQTVRELIADLEAWQQRKPLPSRPAGIVYRLSLWFSRHPLGAGLLALAAFLAGYGAWSEARNAGMLAAANQAAGAWFDASGGTLDLVEDLLMLTAPGQRSPDGASQDALTLAQRRYEQAPPGQPLAAARLATTLARLRFRLDQRNEAIELFRRAREHLQRLPKPRPLMTAAIDLELAHAIGHRGHTGESRSLLGRVLELVPETAASDEAFLLRQYARRGLAFARLHAGEPRDFLAALRELHADYRARFGEDHRATRESATVLADAEREYGDPQSAHAATAVSLAGASTTTRWSHDVRARLVTARADLDRGNLQAARSCAEAVLADNDARRAGEGSHGSVVAREILAVVATRKGRHTEALQYLQELFELHNERYGNGHRTTVRAARNLAATLANLGRSEQALAFLEQHTPAVGAQATDGAQLVPILEVRAVLEQRHGDPERAIPLWDRIIATNAKHYGRDHHRTLSSRRRRAAARSRAGHHQPALAELDEVLDLVSRQFEPASRQRLDVLASKAWVLANQGNLDDAGRELEQRLQAAMTAHGPAHGTVQSALRDLRRFAAEHGRMPTFRAALEAVTNAYRARLTDGEPSTELASAWRAFQQRWHAPQNGR